MDRANDFYKNLGTRTVRLSPEYDHESKLPEYSSKSTLTEFPVPSLLETREHLKKLKNGRAPGMDGIRALTLKNNLDFFTPVLQHLIERIFVTSRFPTR